MQSEPAHSTSLPHLPAPATVLDLEDRHGRRAALRGNPSFVWRAGQDRRLGMIAAWGLLDIARPANQILVDGCGVGMYVRALQPYATQVHGIDIEADFLTRAGANAPGASLELAACERLPYPTAAFDLVLSHEVLEHVQDDRAAVAEMVRVTRPGGRVVVFVPNRRYPFETHGHYWRGTYHFGNTPLINYLPDVLRNRLAPHVRTYTAMGLVTLFVGLPVRIVHLAQIYPGYDNLAYRRPALGRWLRRATYALERSPFQAFGISHFLVAERVA
jgi:SAM-dependent methyltransferase